MSDKDGSSNATTSANETADATPKGAPTKSEPEAKASGSSSVDATKGSSPAKFATVTFVPEKGATASGTATEVWKPVEKSTVTQVTKPPKEQSGGAAAAAKTGGLSASEKKKAKRLKQRAKAREVKKSGATKVAPTTQSSVPVPSSTGTSAQVAQPRVYSNSAAGYALKKCDEKEAREAKQTQPKAQPPKPAQEKLTWEWPEWKDAVKTWTALTKPNIQKGEFNPRLGKTGYSRMVTLKTCGIQMVEEFNIGRSDRYKCWQQWVLCLLREKPIAIYNDELATMAEDLGMNYRRTQQIAATTHPKAKFVRDVVDRLCLIEALAQCEKHDLTAILDLFGSVRLKELWDSVSDEASDVFTRPIDLFWYRPLITPKDHIDYAAALQDYPSEPCPTGGIYGIMQDVYQPVDEILRLFKEHKVVCGMVATQIFHEHVVAGCHFDTMPYYVADGLVQQASGATDHIWPATHQNGKWISHTAHRLGDMTFLWDTYRVISDTSLIRIDTSFRDIPIPPPNLVKDPKSYIETKVLRSRTWANSCSNWILKLTAQTPIFDRPLMVFMPAIRRLEGSMVMKTRATYQVSNLHREVQEVLLKPEYARFWAAVPLKRSDVLRDTILWLTWSDFQDDLSNWQAAARVMGDDVGMFKTLKSKMQSSLPWRKLGLVAVVIVYLLYKSRKFFKNPRELLAWLCTAPSLPITSSKRRTTFDNAIVAFSDTWNGMYGAFYDLVRKYSPVSRARTDLFLGFALMLHTPFLEETFKKRYFGGTLAISFIEAASIYSTQLAMNEANPALPPVHAVVFPIVLLTKYVVHSALRLSPNPAAYHAGLNALVSGVAGMSTPGLGGLTLGSLCAFVLALPSSVAPPPTSFQQFSEDYVDVRSHEEEYLPFDQLELPKLPSILQAPEYSDCPIAQDAVLEAGTEEGIFILLGTSQCFYRPNGPLNFWHAYKQRNRESVPMTMICEEKQDPPLPHQVHPWTHCVWKPNAVTNCPIDRVWFVAVWFMKNLIVTSQIEEPLPLHSLEWITHFNGAAKKARARDAIVNRNDGSVVERSGIFLKADEVLYGRETGLKGRTVKSLDPTIQALTYKAIDAAMLKLKQICDGKAPWKQGKWLTTFAVGSGRTADELDAWFEQALEWVPLADYRIAAIFAGDDFFALVREKGELYAIENDFAKFDRTQGVHALGAEYKILKLLGVSHFQCGALFKTMLSNPRYETKKFEYRKNLWMPPQRATGGPNTTIGNTLTNMMSVLLVLSSGIPLTEMPAFQLKLGFLAKMQMLPRYELGTFLKGWWVPGVDRAIWVPLPSQVIKLGKIMTDPRLIFPKLAAPQAWKAAASSMAASYGFVPREYPILGPFLKRYSELSEERLILPGEEAFRYRVKRELPIRILREQALEMICERYQLTLEDIEQLEEEIRTVPFPSIMTSLAWGALARKDYG
jgi:hypothetical protein